MLGWVLGRAFVWRLLSRLSWSLEGVKGCSVQLFVMDFNDSTYLRTLIRPHIPYFLHAINGLFHLLFTPLVQRLLLRESFQGVRKLSEWV